MIKKRAISAEIALFSYSEQTDANINILATVHHFCIIFVLLSLEACMNRYVLFTPVYSKEDELIIATETPEPDFYSNLKQVLEFYDVVYQETADGMILVPAHLLEDRDLIWNYTTKANDETWLQEH
ncbi:MAG: hypothetical protein ACPG8W_09875 [Candidatus Promineifilaceae bacterium]